MVPSASTSSSSSTTTAVAQRYYVNDAGIENKGTFGIPESDPKANFTDIGALFDSTTQKSMIDMATTIKNNISTEMIQNISQKIVANNVVQAGCGGVLMLPPFYYKGVSDEGIYRYFASIADAVADSRLRIYLYHIPPVSQVPISLALIERLLTEKASKGSAP